MSPRDLPAQWTSARWRAEVERWVRDSLGAVGREVTGPVEQPRVRFWSTQLTVPTERGTVWFKENAPSQAFEARLVEVVDGVAPGCVPAPVAVDGARGWLLSDDLGVTMWDAGEVGTDATIAVLQGYAGLQRALAGHRDVVLASGIAAFPSGAVDVTAWVAGLVEDLRALPVDDPRRLTEDESARVAAGTARVGEAADVLAASGIPDSVQHNDLHTGNAFRRPDGTIAYIDLGDSLWTHPFTSARIPLWMLHRPEVGGADEGRAADAYLEVWTDLAPLGELRRTLAAAERIACLHRAESWRRLQWDVPLACVRGAFERAVPDWLTIAAVEDPLEAALAQPRRGLAKNTRTS